MDTKKKKLIVAVVLLAVAAVVITFNAVRVFSPPAVEIIDPDLVKKPEAPAGGARVLDGDQ